MKISSKYIFSCSCNSENQTNENADKDEDTDHPRKMSRSITIFRKNSLFPESRSTSRSSILGDSNNGSSESSSSTTFTELQENVLRYSVVARQTLPPLEKISAESSQLKTVLHKSPS